MAASSSSSLQNVQSQGELHPLLEKNKILKTLPSELADQPVTPHDIFLSHSGAQKGFVKDLYCELSHLNFNTFLDITHHSLPLAESFPKKIFSAAKNCKLAVVVLSDQFLTSKWPMLELSTFVIAGVQILPLFFQLSPADLKDDSKVTIWKTAWENFAAQDIRIQLTEWQDAINALCSKNGLTFKGPAIEGETTYLRRVVSGICEIVPFAIKFDGPHRHGMDRLCEVILDRFDEMETPKKVNVLGLYGLPGSGKSTLCKCLCNIFIKIYGSKRLYLELPTRPSSADLVHKFKMLLCLTDFKDRCNLDSVSDLEQLFNLLESSQLQRRRVFLVIDNISDDSWEAVQMFLPLLLEPGSKVVLVARTFEILRPAFRLLKQHEQHYTSKYMEIPSIQEIEAIQILLQASGVGTVASVNGRAVQHINLTPTQRATIVRIVRMCNFGRSNCRPQYLPLVMKTMGSMLIKCEGDFARWGRDLENFWGRVKTCKDKALHLLVERSFEALPDEELQILFLDMSLFIVPLNLQSRQEVYVLLSSIYDGRSVADIQLMIKDLERHCFFTIDARSKICMSFHDVYLEFAESISEDPSRFNHSIRYYWRNYKYEGANDGKVLSLKEVEREGYKRTRTMILEVQGDGYERVELQGFSSLKALVVRGSRSLEVLEVVGAQSLKVLVVRDCQSLKVLGLEGLSSLVSLEILHCPNFRHMDGNLDLCNVKRLLISSPKGGQAGDKGGLTSLHAGWGWLGEALLDLARVFKWPQTPQRPSLEMRIATKMRGLQDLRLENTGIRRLPNMGRCFPQLQNLTVKECSLEAFEVGNLPNLKRFYFDDNVQAPVEYDYWRNYVIMEDDYRRTQVWESKKDNPRFMLQGKGLLEGCLQLEQAEIHSAFFEEFELGTLPPNLKSFKLDSFYPARMLPDLSPSAHMLEQVHLQWCEKLERINFLVEFGKLTKLVVRQCHSLVELTGLNFVFSLRELCVQSCSNLRAILGPFDNLKMLENFEVEGCSKVRGLSGADLENIVTITKLHFPLDRHRCFNLKNLENLQSLKVTSWQIIDGESNCSPSTKMQQQQQHRGMLEGLEGLVNLKWLCLYGDPSSNHKLYERINPALSLSFSSLVGLDQHPIAQAVPSRSYFRRSGKCLSVGALKLKNLRDLASIDGLAGQYLPKLNWLKLHCLENLRSVQGLESLVHLKSLSLRCCTMLEEIPSLNTLVNLETLSIHHCSKLKAVDGADAILTRGKLDGASFKGCESLVHLPFSVSALRERDSLRTGPSSWLKFKDCKFAGTEAVLAWLANEDMPWSLRRASFVHLHKKYRMDDSGSLREVLLDALFPFLLNFCFPDDEICLDFGYLACNISALLYGAQRTQLKPESSSIVWELQKKFGGLVKKDLVRTFQAHLPECKLLILSLLDELGFSICKINFNNIGVGVLQTLHSRHFAGEHGRLRRLLYTSINPGATIPSAPS